LFAFDNTAFSRISFVLILVVSQLSMASVIEPLKEPLMEDTEWDGGWVFLAGIGATAARTVTDTDSERAMVGPNISTSVGYCEKYTYCIEIGSLTSANFYSNIKGKTQGKDVNASVLMWESSYFLSTRIKFPGVKPTNLFNPGFKLLGGYGNSVAFIREIDDVDIAAQEGIRIHNEGPLMGASLIFFFNAMDYSFPWYIEMTSILQLHWNSYIVQPQGVVPVVLEEGFAEGNTRIVRFNLSIGTPLFY
jgi:hypothetical protein